MAGIGADAQPLSSVKISPSSFPAWPNSDYLMTIFKSRKQYSIVGWNKQPPSYSAGKSKK
jgi:hypothetical protein